MTKIFLFAFHFNSWTDGKGILWNAYVKVGWNIMKKDYFKFMKWAVVHFIPRNTQDDRRDKLHISGLFESPVSARDNFLVHLPNKDVKRYIVHVDDLEAFERFYNFVNDLKEDRKSVV